MNLQLRIDTSRISTLSLTSPVSPHSPRLLSPLPRSPTFPTFPMPPQPQEASSLTSSMTSLSLTPSPSLQSLPRLPSVQEGFEMTSLPVTSFPRLPSVSDGLFEYTAHDVGPEEAAMFNAAGNMDLKAMEDILNNKGVDVNYTCSSLNYRTVLHELVIGSVLQDLFDTHKQQHLRFIDLLTLMIHHGLDVNAVDMCKRSALHFAASYPGQKDMIKVLLASGAKANLTDICQQSALHKAVLKATCSDVETLLDGGADPNLLDSMGLAPIHLAAKRKFHPDTLSLLLQSGGNANVRDMSRGQRGSTPLHAAVKMADMNNVRALLARGASVDLTDTSGQSAIHLAASHDLTGKVLECLIRHGASVNDQDATYRETPLHKAVKSDMIENFKILVKKGANPNIKDDQNETVLHKAASCTKPFIWVSLVKLGGDPTVKNRSGLSPLDKADKAKNHLACSIMKEKMDS